MERNSEGCRDEVLGEGGLTFLVDPLHGEELLVVHGAHVLHLPVQTLV